MTLDPQKLHDYVDRLANLEEINAMSDENLQKLKDNHKLIINSKRKFEAIRTVQDLFACLRIRGILTNINEINLAFEEFVSKEHQVALYEEFKDVAYGQIKRKNYYKLARQQLQQQNFELNRLRWEEIGILLDDVTGGRERHDFVRHLAKCLDGPIEEEKPTKETIRQSLESNHNLSDSDQYHVIRESLAKAGRRDLVRKLTAIEKWPHDN
jgi:hypothetical protein